MPLVPALDRRDLLNVCAGAALGFGFPLRRTCAAETTRSKSVILVNLTGGLSHIDSLDMKPEAPSETRGEFKPIATTLPGVQVCEHLPLLAARMKHWCLVRSLSHRENGHLPGSHRLMTGATMPLQRSTDLDNVLSRRDWPCFAAGLDYFRPRHDGVPNGVTLPHALIEGPLTWPGQHAGFLGPAHDPMLVTQDPNSPKFRMEAFALPEGTDPDRVAGRKSLLDQLESNGVGDPAFREHRQRAFELLASGRVATAFRLDSADPRQRDRYGRNLFGQSLFLARRLTEAGVPIVQANMGIVQTWDTHTDNWGKLKTRLLPWLDRGLAALIEDLTETGLIDQTFVVVSGEFGRTPRISTLPGEKIAGRDHWAAAYSGLFAGGGVAGGRVIGKTDKAGAYPVTPSYSPFDVGATIYQALGIEPEREFKDPQNRPSRVCSGTPIAALFEGR